MSPDNALHRVAKSLTSPGWSRSQGTLVMQIWLVLSHHNVKPITSLSSIDVVDKINGTALAQVTPTIASSC